MVPSWPHVHVLPLQTILKQLTHFQKIWYGHHVTTCTCMCSNTFVHAAVKYNQMHCKLPERVSNLKGNI